MVFFGFSWKACYYIRSYAVKRGNVRFDDVLVDGALYD